MLQSLNSKIASLLCNANDAAAVVDPYVGRGGGKEEETFARSRGASKEGRNSAESVARHSVTRSTSANGEQKISLAG